MINITRLPTIPAMLLTLAVAMACPTAFAGTAFGGRRAILTGVEKLAVKKLVKRKRTVSLTFVFENEVWFALNESGDVVLGGLYGARDKRGRKFDLIANPHDGSYMPRYFAREAAAALTPEEGDVSPAEIEALRERVNEARERLASLSAELGLAEQELELLRRLEAEGAVPANEVQAAERRVEALRQAVAAARDELGRAEAALRSATTLSPPNVESRLITEKLRAKFNRDRTKVVVSGKVLVASDVGTVGERMGKLSFKLRGKMRLRAGVLGDVEAELLSIATSEIVPGGHDLVPLGSFSSATISAGNLSGIDVLVIAPGAASQGSTAALDEIIADHVAAGGGLVVTEWGSRQPNYSATIRELLPFTGGGRLRSSFDWEISSPRHPIAAELPRQWTDSVSVRPGAELKEGAEVIIKTPDGSPIVAAWRRGGAVVRVNASLSGNVASAELKRIILNAVEFARK